MEKSDMCDMYKNMLSEVDKLLRIYFSNLCYSGAFIFTNTIKNLK